MVPKSKKAGDAALFIEIALAQLFNLRLLREFEVVAYESRSPGLSAPRLRRESIDPPKPRSHFDKLGVYKDMKPIVRTLLCCCIVKFSGGLLCMAQQREPADLKLSLVQTSGGTQPTFELTFENVSTRDLSLHLGMMLGNGRKQYPDVIHFRLEEPSGNILSLELTGPALIAGRIDPMILPLPAGCRFTLPVDLHKYHDSKQHVWRVDLKPGHYRLQADYSVAARASDLNSGMHDVALIPQWIGHVSSMPLSFEATTH